MGKHKIKADDANTIGTNIRRIRLDEGIGQTEMASRVQLFNVPLTRESLVKIEGGRQHISLEQLKAIREILGCSYDDLLEDPVPAEKKGGHK